MSSHGHRVARDLSRLHDVALLLFELVSEEYQPTPKVTLELTACDAVADNPHCSDPVVRLVIVAQLLWHATRDPAVASPRHIAGLGLFADELIPAMLTARQPQGRETEQQLHEIRGEIDTLCMNLMVATDPGTPDFLSG